MTGRIDFACSIELITIWFPQEGRNPIVEQVRNEASSYVANGVDMEVSDTGKHCLIITGPNMGGKSSYLRQVALIVVLAQIGCFVPAKECELTPFDSIHRLVFNCFFVADNLFFFFTSRMGAWDNPLAGQSTYYVELQQTSQILSNVTSKSLVILDELGRGTSTIDGCSLAYATLKHLLLNVKCCTLFVTHYWLLTSLEAEYPENVANLEGFRFRPCLKIFLWMGKPQFWCGRFLLDPSQSSFAADLYPQRCNS